MSAVARQDKPYSPKHPIRVVTATALFATGLAPAALAGGSGNGGPPPEVRFATFNASLNRFNAGDLAAELSASGSAQPDVIAEIIQRVRPDVLLINEFDFDSGNFSPIQDDPTGKIAASLAALIPRKDEG